MIDPGLLCNQHLLGEHVELHMTKGCIDRGYEKSVIGLARAGLLETDMVVARHAELVKEMLARGMNHHSPLDVFDFDALGSVDRTQSLNTLWNRCLDCRAIQRANHAETDMKWVLPITHVTDELQDRFHADLHHRLAELATRKDLRR